MERVLQIAGVLLFLFGIYIWFDFYKSYSGVYSFRLFSLPFYMFVSLCLVLFSNSFDDLVKELSFYVRIVGIIILIGLVFLTKNTLQANGL